MQRVRVGLTGLAVVLIIVVLASVLFAQFFDKSPVEQGAANAAAAAQKAGDEPLADLGIAPGAPDTAANQTK